MRIAISVITLTIMALSLTGAAEDPWFDMQNCEMCKYLLEDPGLLNHMAMEYHGISAGLVSVCRVDPEYVDSYLKAKQGMMETGARLMRGEPVRLCNMCKSLGDIFAMGARQDLVESGDSYIVVTTSDKPGVVEKIHAWGERTEKEMLAQGWGGHPDQH